MTTATFMATFNKDVVEADIFSEANAVTYKLVAKGQTNYSPTARLELNDSNIIGSVANGLNIRGMNGPSVAEIKSFELTNVDSSMNSSFKTFMDTSTHKILVIISGRSLRSTPDIDSWFSSKGSVAWPGNFMLNNYSCGYVGFYSTKLKKIVAEKAIYSDGNEIGLAEYLLVFDTLDDIGALGTPQRVVYDENEYSTTTGYEFKRYPVDTTIVKMADYNMTKGGTFLIQADLVASQTMVAANMKTRVNLRWFQGTTLLNASTVLESIDTSKTSVQGYSTAPPTADGFALVVSRYPRNDAVSGLASVKNMMFTEVSRDGSQINSTAAVGIYGVKANGFVESQSDNHLMDLKVDSTSLLNIVPIVGIREGTSTTPPQPII